MILISGLCEYKEKEERGVKEYAPIFKGKYNQLKEIQPE
jgi:hypothetical protein